MSATAHDIHRLLHFPETQGLSESTSGKAIILIESASAAMPFGWLFLFGSRNIWEPGQTVEDRGGAAATRDPTVTPIDIAQVRLHEAAGVLRADGALGPICAGLELLERVLEAAGERGQLRLQSPPGAFGEDKNPSEKRSRFLERVAVAENIVFHLGNKAGRQQVGHALNTLQSLCAFVPTGDLASDWRELQKAAKKLGGRCPVEESAVRLMVGWPTGGRMNTLFAAETPGIMQSLKEKAAAAPAGGGYALAGGRSGKAASASASGAGAKKPWWAFWKR